MEPVAWISFGVLVSAGAYCVWMAFVTNKELAEIEKRMAKIRERPCCGSCGAICAFCGPLTTNDLPPDD